MVKMDYVWDRTVEFLGDNLSAVLPFAVLGLFVPTSIMNALTPLWQDAGQGAKLILTLVFVALTLAMFWGSLAITALAIDPGGRAGLAAHAARRLPPMVGVYALFILGFVVLIVPIGVLAAVAGLDMAAMQAGRPMAPLASPAAGWAMALYVLTFLIAVLVISARMMPVAAVIVAERRGIGAIGRAWQLTRGMAWRLVGVTILYFAVSQVAALAARTVFGTLLRLVGGGEGPVTVGAVVTGVVVAAVSAGFSTLAAIFAAKLYVAVQGPPPQPTAAAFA